MKRWNYAVLDTFGKIALIQRCQVQKKRNELSYLPESAQANVSIALTIAYREFDYETAKRKLLGIASDLEYKYPKAAASLLEGLEERLTDRRLKVPGVLRETLCSTNPMESAHSACRGIICRVSHYQDGEMALCYAASRIH